MNVLQRLLKYILGEKTLTAKVAGYKKQSDKALSIFRKTASKLEKANECIETEIEDINAKMAELQAIKADLHVNHGENEKVRTKIIEIIA